MWTRRTEVRRRVSPLHISPDLRQLAIGEACQWPRATRDALDFGRNPSVTKSVTARVGVCRTIPNFNPVARSEVRQSSHYFSLPSRQGKSLKSDIGLVHCPLNQEDQLSIVGIAFPRVQARPCQITNTRLCGCSRRRNHCYCDKQRQNRNFLERGIAAAVGPTRWSPYRPCDWRQ